MSIETPPGQFKPVSDESPPFLGSWPRVYAAALGWLAVLILLLFVFAKVSSL